MTFVSQQASILGSHREEPHFSNQDLRLGPVVEKANAAFIIHQSAMTRGILFHKGQPCLTSSDLPYENWMVGSPRNKALIVHQFSAG